MNSPVIIRRELVDFADGSSLSVSVFTDNTLFLQLNAGITTVTLYLNKADTVQLSDILALCVKTITVA